MTPSSSSAASPSTDKASIGSIDDLARIFNTALVASRIESSKNFSAELYALMETPAFRAILGSISQLAIAEGISEREAAESVIRTFRRMDQVWNDYVVFEGVDRLKSQIS